VILALLAFAGAAAAMVPVTGIAAGEVLVAIDTRPQNGRLYGPPHLRQQLRGL